jgi:predicted nucleotidyltransferase
MSTFKDNILFPILYNAETTLKQVIIKKESQKFFKKHREIGAVYLCGSYAKGSPNVYSDVDLLIFFNKGIQYQRKKRKKEVQCNWWGKKTNLELILEKPIDLFDGDFLIYNGNHIVGTIFELMDKSKLIYHKEGFVIPDLKAMKKDYDKFRKWGESLKSRE